MSTETLEVLVPERGRPDLLARCLDALETALAGLEVPATCRVLVNGHPESDYAELRHRHPRIDWRFERRPLGFHGAISALLAAARGDWVFLLNSDMRLASDALAHCWRWRGPGVFAVAAQIEFADPHRRREETGYTAGVVSADGSLELHDLLPPDVAVRGSVYAGGGASLFLRALLVDVLADSRCYAPFYFEDADWALQAWARGYATLYCPAARATHEHRATIGRYYDADEIARVIRRNLDHFRFRYGDLFGARRRSDGLAARLAHLGRHLSGGHRRARTRVLASTMLPDPRWLAQRIHPEPPRRHRERALALLVAHRPLPELALADPQGALSAWLNRQTAESDLIVLEPAGTGARRMHPLDAGCRAVHPVGAGDFRVDLAAAAALRHELRRLRDRHEVAAVWLTTPELREVVAGQVAAPHVLPWKIAANDVGVTGQAEMPRETA